MGEADGAREAETRGRGAVTERAQGEGNRPNANPWSKRQERRRRPQGTLLLRLGAAGVKTSRGRPRARPINPGVRTTPFPSWKGKF